MFLKSTKMRVWQGYEQVHSVTYMVLSGSTPDHFYLFAMIPFFAFPILKSDVL
jgi:hypothetical protein